MFDGRLCQQMHSSLLSSSGLPLSSELTVTCGCAGAQVTDPRGASGGKWDCFASYRLALVHPTNDAKTIARDSWHRFSGAAMSRRPSPCCTLVNHVLPTSNVLTSYGNLLTPLALEE